MKDRRISIVAVCTYLGVFVAPWFVPMRSAAIVSDSLAAGFSNRTSVVALLLGCIALFALALRQALAKTDAEEDEAALVSAQSPSSEDRLSPWVVVCGIVATFAIVGIGAVLLGNQPHGDAAYFCDRLFRMVAGERPYVDFEFSYGPVLIYGPWGVYRVLGSRLGLGIYASYYLWVGFAYSVALLLVAYIVNRVSLTRVQRTAAFVLIAAMTVFNPTLGVNYSALRFMIPYALFLWALGCVQGSRNAVLRWVAPLAAMGLAFVVTPEMGIALLIALGIALALLVYRQPKANAGPLIVLVAGIACYVIVLRLSGSGTMGALAAGAFYLPVLPGPSAVLFVASALLVGWGVGTALPASSHEDQATQLGWLALVAILAVPAFGRADFMHIFWNGIGVVLVAAAVAGRRWRLGTAYIGVAAAVFLVAMSIFSLRYSSTPYVTGVKRLLYGSEARAVRVSELRGKPVKAGLKLHRSLADQDRKQETAAKRLSDIPNVAFLAVLWNRPGMRISKSGNTVPVYSFPGNALTSTEFEASVAELDAAKNLVVPTREYVAYEAAAKRARSNGAVAGDIVMKMPNKVGTPSWYGLLQGVPVQLQGRNEVFDPVASFGLVMDRDWIAYDTIEGHTWLKRR
ncbi:MAG TPA: hypothetical protein VFG89_03020 [Coriobacteriia bacterium]|nr:hypothetical protein [Coriobacteriia bacterium]